MTITATTTEQPVYDVIVRVSKVGYREATLDSDREQEAMSRAKIAALGGVVGVVHVEKDVSGKTTNRVALNAAKDRVLSGKAHGVVAAYVSRFSRNTVEGLELVQAILGAGREFIALDLGGMDLRTPAGEQFLTMQLAAARAEWRMRQAGFNDAREKAIARGVHLSERFGYRKGADGKLIPDPVEGPWVPAIYERRAKGVSWPALADWLNSEGVKPHRFSDRKDARATKRKMGDKWTHNRVKQLVESRVYLGEARSGEFVNADAHKPLVSVELFNACEALRDLRPRRGSADYELSGILRCACGERMRGSTTTKNATPYRYYKCSNRACKSKMVRATVVEGFVHAELAPVVAGLRAVAREKTGTLDAALAHLADMEAMKSDVAGDLELRAIDRNAYLSAVAEANDRVTKAKATVRQTRARVTGVSITPEHVDNWTDLPIDVRRRMLAEAFEAVFISPDRSGIAVIGRGETVDAEYVAGLAFSVV